jgi:hypothetical protein
MTPEEYRAHVKAVADSLPPLNAAQADLCSRILLPEGWTFVAHPEGETAAGDQSGA